MNIDDTWSFESDKPPLVEEHEVGVIVKSAPKMKRKKGKPSQADLLVALANDAELFHTPEGDAYATITINNHRETWAVNSKGFRRWLAGQCWAKYRKAPNGEALQSALCVIAGKAIHDGSEHQVYVRIAEYNGNIIVDLGNAEWEVVEITPNGWHIRPGENVPVKFIRKPGMLPLPVPVKGGNLADLRALVTVPDDQQWVLFLGWLVMAFRPRGPYPLLDVTGEQGSAKSTLCRYARDLVDPNQAALRRPPRDDRDVMIAAANAWIVAFENLSGISPALSDVLCCLSTGSGFATRELYTDGDEKIFSAMRPTMVNGIGDQATRPDLLDRAVTLSLPAILDHLRRDEEDLHRQFAKARPEILGALLDGVSAALRRYDQIHLDRLPRMADFAKWATAAEPGLGLEDGAFMAAYMANRDAAVSLAIESSPVGPAVLKFMESRWTWTGTASDLLAELSKDGITDERTRRGRDWPGKGRAVSNILRRLAPDLRRMGVVVNLGARTRQARIITIEKVGIPSSPSSPSSPDAPGGSENTVFGPEGVTKRDEADNLFRHPEICTGGIENADCDGGDERDAVAPPSLEDWP